MPSQSLNPKTKLDEGKHNIHLPPLFEQLTSFALGEVINQLDTTNMEFIQCSLAQHV
jgi:hypothetical protein